ERSAYAIVIRDRLDSVRALGLRVRVSAAAIVSCLAAHPPVDRGAGVRERGAMGPEARSAVRAAERVLRPDAPERPCAVLPDAAGRLPRRRRVPRQRILSRQRRPVSAAPGSRAAARSP